MGVIENDEAAVRLARAIVRDIELYNAAIITAGADLSEPIAEGRQLYRTRVVERCFPFFEDALMARDLARLDMGRTEPVRAASQKPSPVASAHDAFLAPLPARSEGSGLGALVLGLVVLVAALAGWFFLRGG